MSSAADSLVSKVGSLIDEQFSIPSTVEGSHIECRCTGFGGEGQVLVAGGKVGEMNLGKLWASRISEESRKDSLRGVAGGSRDLFKTAGGFFSSLLSSAGQIQLQHVMNGPDGVPLAIPALGGGYLGTSRYVPERPAYKPITWWGDP